MKFFKELKNLKLTNAEKQKSLDFLLARIEPVRNVYNIRQNKQKVPFLPLLLNHKYMLAGLLIAAILAMGGGTAVAAENSLPGDLLYPIKTQVNEEVRSALAITPEAQAAWDTQRAERRLQEAEKLADEGKLTTSTSEMLATKFKEFADKADARLQKLEDSGKLTTDQVQQLKDNFEVAVKAHDEVLSRIQDKEQIKANLKMVLDSLKEEASSTIKDRLEHEMKLIDENTTSTLKTLAENRKNAAENKIAEVQKFIDNNEDKVSEENKNAATEKLSEAKNLVQAGDQLATIENYGEAILKYSEAQRTAQEAQMYMTTRFKLERRLEATTSTPAVFASGTLQFPNEKRQAVWDAHENLKDLEQKLREEVKQAKSNLRDGQQLIGEKIREFRKENRPENTSSTAITTAD